MPSRLTLNRALDKAAFEFDSTTVTCLAELDAHCFSHVHTLSMLKCIMAPSSVATLSSQRHAFGSFWQAPPRQGLELGSSTAVLWSPLVMHVMSYTSRKSRVPSADYPLDRDASPPP